MNVKEYIASGIVESYVLGLASEQERGEFEQLCANYPELIEARTNFELLLEKRAIENAGAPPPDNRAKIWSAIGEDSASNAAKLVTMEPTTRVRSSGLRWVAAASIILMIAAGYFAVDYYNKNRELRESNDEMIARMNRMDSILNQMKEEQAIIQNPGATVINVKALKQTPNPPSANVYWDSTATHVYLLVKNMPQLASDKQYQLWSIIDSAGKKMPTSLGLFDGGNSKVMLRMEGVQKADAFAITIEPRGNTGPPHLDDMQAMGKTRL